MNSHMSNATDWNGGEGFVDPEITLMCSRARAGDMDSFAKLFDFYIGRLRIYVPGDDLRVSCTLPDGERIDSTLSKLSAGTYRITIEIPKSISKKYIANSTELSLAFKTTRLDEVLSGKARFTW